MASETASSLSIHLFSILPNACCFTARPKNLSQTRPPFLPKTIQKREELLSPVTRIIENFSQDSSLLQKFLACAIQSNFYNAFYFPLESETAGIYLTKGPRTQKSLQSQFEIVGIEEGNWCQCFQGMSSLQSSIVVFSAVWTNNSAKSLGLGLIENVLNIV